MKKLLILIFCIGLTSSAYAEKRTFKVGMILPMSGHAADYGTSIDNCVRLAEKDNPKQFSNIEFITEDAEHDPKKAIAAFNKLINLNKVDLIYTFGVSFCKALAPIAESRKIPLVGQCIDQESSAGRKYVVRFMNYTDEYLQAQTEELAKRNLKKIGVLLTDHAYLEEMFAALERSLLPGQTLEIIDRFQSGNLDLRSSIAKIKRSDFDVIGVFLYPGQVSEFYKQASQQRLKVPSFGTNIFESVSEIKLAAGTMDGSIFANNPVSREFQKRYEKEFNSISQLGFGALGYEFARMTGSLFNSTLLPLSGEEIIQKIINVEKEQGLAAGPYEFKDSRIAGQYFYFPIAIKEIEGENFKIRGVY